MDDCKGSSDKINKFAYKLFNKIPIERTKHDVEYKYTAKKIQNSSQAICNSETQYVKLKIHHQYRKQVNETEKKMPRNKLLS